MELNGRKIPNHLRKLRKQMGLTQKEVASLLGFVATKRIILWEQGKAQPSLYNLFRLSIIYSVDPHELYPEHYDELREQLLSSIEDVLFTKHFPIPNEISN